MLDEKLYVKRVQIGQYSIIVYIFQIFRTREKQVFFEIHEVGIFGQIVFFPIINKSYEYETAYKKSADGIVTQKPRVEYGVERNNRQYNRGSDPARAPKQSEPKGNFMQEPENEHSHKHHKRRIRACRRQIYPADKERRNGQYKSKHFQFIVL